MLEDRVRQALINDLRAQKEAIEKSIKEEFIQSSNGLVINTQAIATKLTDIQGEINECFVDLKARSLQKAAYKRLETNVKAYYKDQHGGRYTAADFDEALSGFLASGQNRSRTFKTLEAIKNYRKVKDETFDQNKADEYKVKLMGGYAAIMTIRNQIVNHPISYGLYLISTGENKKITMGQPSIEELFAMSNVSAGSRGISLQLQLTAEEMRSLIQEFGTKGTSTLSEQFNESFESERSQRIWEILKMVKDKMIDIEGHGKKVFYSYGQLLESFVYLQDRTSIQTKDVYMALKQGKNTVSFEKQGDFRMQFQDADFDIQAKALSMNLDEDNMQKLSSRANLIKLSNITRVLSELIIIFGNPSNVLQGLRDYFSVKINEHEGEIEKTGVEAGVAALKEIEPMIENLGK